MKNKNYLRKFIAFFLVLLLFVAGQVSFAPFAEASALNEDSNSEDISYKLYYLDDDYSKKLSLLDDIVADHNIMALVYLCDSLSLKAEPCDEAESLLSMGCGTTVNILKAHVLKENGSNVLWYEVSVLYNGKNYEGYLKRDNLAVSDAQFLDWEAVMKTAIAKSSSTRKARLFLAGSSNSVSYSDIEQFPESYQAALKTIKDAHPNWVFVPLNTGLDWQSAIDNELANKKSLIYKTAADYNKEGLCETGWYFASENILKYYMDPRNWLNEKNIFQFELLSYNQTNHTESAVSSLLAGSFMKDGATGYGLTAGQSFSNIFCTAGSANNVSPFHLAARVLQEQGQNGSQMVSGTYAGYEGLYNFFNIGATSGTATEKLTQGLSYARTKSWTNAYTSITEGAGILAKNYIQKGQDTLYLQKFNVTSQNNNTYGHQYMQNISAPVTESTSIYNQYAKACNMSTSTFVFKIPVYKNMPESLCEKPSSTTNVVLNIPEGYDTTVYVDGIEMASKYRNAEYIIDTGSSTAKSAVVYKYNTNGVPTGMYVWTFNYSNGNYYETEETDLTDLLGYHGFSIRITGKSGIRFKSSISKEVRDKLTGSGIDGYKLTEYGTLIMNKANMETYPFVYGGSKMNTATAYNSTKDNIYATKDGRYQFTAVLVGIPATSYKTQLAFRSYAVLEKNGQKTVIYGPVLSRDIYDLAKQYIDNKTYSAGSSQYEYLTSIINDAK